MSSRRSKTKKKGGSDFPPFAEIVKRIKLPPWVPGGIEANMARFNALVGGVAREMKRMVKQRKRG